MARHLQRSQEMCVPGDVLGKISDGGVDGDGDGDGDKGEAPRLTVSAKTPSQSKSRAAILAFRPTTPPRAGRVDLQELAAGEEILPNPSEVLKASAPPSPARATSAALLIFIPPTRPPQNFGYRASIHF
jgi:hypothetical protein